MDDQYLDAFIRESEEAITELNNSLLELESDPSNTEAMDSIFRTAHTLKGNFGAMGSDTQQTSTQAMEDLLDGAPGEMEVTPDLMDLVFAGVDQIEVIVGEIEEHGESGTETDEMVEELRAVLEEGAAAAGDTETTDDGSSDSDESLTTDAGVSDADIDGDAVDERVLQAEISVGESDMLGVDSMLAVESIEGRFDILDSSPSRADIEDGEFDDTFVLYLDGPDAATVDAELGTTGKVDSFDVTDVTDELVSGTGTDSDAADDSGAGSDSGSDPDPGAEEEHSVDEIKSVRVDVDQLDDLHELVEQLVTSRIKLRRGVEEDDLDSTGETLNELDKISTNLQNTVMDMRLIPLKKVSTSSRGSSATSHANSTRTSSLKSKARTSNSTEPSAPRFRTR